MCVCESEGSRALGKDMTRIGGGDWMRGKKVGFVSSILTAAVSVLGLDVEADAPDFL